MQVKIGDRVCLIFTQEEGVVVDFFDHDSVAVRLDESQEEIPVFLEHLKVIPPKEQVVKANSGKKVGKKISVAEAASKIKAIGLNTQVDNLPDKGINLYLQPFYHSDKTINYFLLHLHNNTGSALQFHYQLLFFEEIEFELKKDIGGRETIILNTIAYDDLNDSPLLKFNFTLKKIKNKQQFTQFERTVKPKAKMLRKPPVLVANINAEAYVLQAVQKIPIKKLPPPVPKADVKKINPMHMKARMLFRQEEQQNYKERVYVNAEERVVDLHIEKLTDNPKSIRKNEILALQLKHFEAQLQEAIKRKEPNMIAIHGIGKGRLKKEIVKVMRQHPEVKRFVNELEPKYGFGATRILFHYTEDD